jgi:hypothetical protein
MATTEVFAHFTGRNSRFLSDGVWQDPARGLSRAFREFTGAITAKKGGIPPGLLGDLCQPVPEGVDNEFETIGNVEF